MFGATGVGEAQHAKLADGGFGVDAGGEGELADARAVGSHRIQVIELLDDDRFGGVVAGDRLDLVVVFRLSVSFSADCRTCNQ
ncbi:MAG: hypothetical protein WCA89_09885 [Terracidiphilus sp.]